LDFQEAERLAITARQGIQQQPACWVQSNLITTKNDSEIKSIIEANYKSEDGTTTQERYLLDLQRNQFYDIERSYYSFIAGEFVNSRFESIDLDATLSLGLGKKLYQTDDTTLTGEIGLGINPQP